MRVLQVVDYMNRAGLETFLMNLYRNIDRNEIQFDFITKTEKKCDYDDEIISLGGKIYSSPSTRNSSLQKVKQFYVDFFNNNPQYNIIHIHVSYFSLTNMIILFAAKEVGISCVIIHSHSSKVKGHKRLYLHKVNQRIAQYLKLYTVGLACSDDAGKWMFGTKKFKSIYNGIEVDRFKYDPEVRSIIRESRGLKNSLVIGHVGRFSEEKNHDYIINIFKMLKQKHNNSKLMLVGTGVRLEEIKNKVKSEGLQDSVIFTGVQDNINELMQAMDIFVFPSFYEGLPVTLVEAQASGLPCLISDKIPRQAKITHLVEFLPIEGSVDVWVHRILDIYKQHRRVSMLNDMHKSGYDIKNTVHELTEIYKHSNK